MSEAEAPKPEAAKPAEKARLTSEADVTKYKVYDFHDLSSSRK